MKAKQRPDPTDNGGTPDVASVRFLDRDLPAQPVDEVRDVALRFYGISGDFQELRSERDQNFLVEDVNGDRFVLKVANAAETPAGIDFQIGALRHIATTSSSLPIPRIVPGRQGLDAHEIRFANGNSHVVYLLTYLDGTLLSQSPKGGAPAVRQQLGVLLAKLDMALRGYFHPAARQPHPWNFETCGRLAPFTAHIENEEHRRIVRRTIERMRATVIPQLRTLRHQVIHHDAHSGNVLINRDDAEAPSGLIDFGDLLFGTIVAEVAIACDGVAGDSHDCITPACELIAGFDSVLPLEEEEIELVFDLVCARNAITATIAATRLALAPGRPAHIANPQRFVEKLQALHDAGRDEYSRRLRAACRFPVSSPSTISNSADADEEARLMAARQKLMGRKTTHFYKQPMHFERGSGNWLHATDGRRYLDFYNNVAQVGHCHPHVVRAIARQAAALNTNTRYLYNSVLEYAERLTERLAPHLTACVFVNSGSEANDVAWQMSKFVTGHSGALIMEDAYHGVTDVIRQFSPGRPGKVLPDFLQGLIVPDPYRGPYRDDDADLVARYAADADRAISDLKSVGHQLAAFMFDSAFCSSGVPNVPDGYLRAVEANVRAAGGLMICDEVQSGFGRMGQWWGHEHHGVRADIVTMGKPVGNGFPLGVVVTTDEVLNQFMSQTRLFSTFGGNAVATAAGNAVLDVIDNENLIARSREVGDYLRHELHSLAADHALIGDVRGHGMVVGVEFVTDRAQRLPATAETAELIELMREQGVLVGSDGRDANVLKLRPPLVTPTRHVDLFIEALDRSLQALQSR
ncbi:MAG: aminotransferase class III-fold pyridoxal phosphate-dependent enzyme [Gammaproteobacteria bacterium]|nr:aminotransferase class III-fold pyridoxal phosphate-dependent enzyme [Gammaproteobacteria bacterium]MBU2677615.1 aminotransferase class III-fold pyridoxal phosphate-dependent enzyme [Gammaproteobacteria bacterium]NNL51347.1 aminotransferase class III-fold pyridoxal phosphate-dependent enzyme [Woeseiaceae bacterium]